MRRLRPPSPTTVIALIALFVALGGTGYAAVKVNGKNVKNATVAGKAFKKNTLTGTQIKESKLATVPRAKRADTADSATTIGPAGTSGLFAARKAPASGLIRFEKAGTSLATSPPRTLLRSGPFEIAGACWNGPMGKTGVGLIFSSAEAGSDLVGQLGTRREETITETTLSIGSSDGFWFHAPSGATLFVDLHIGINRLGSPCYFVVDGVTNP